jgi:hypothetical protein
MGVPFLLEGKLCARLYRLSDREEKGHVRHVRFDESRKCLRLLLRKAREIGLRRFAQVPFFGYVQRPYRHGHDALGRFNAVVHGVKNLERREQHPPALAENPGEVGKLFRFGFVVVE